MTKLFKAEVKKIAKRATRDKPAWILSGAVNLLYYFCYCFLFLFSSSFSSKGLPATSLEKEMLVTVVFKCA